MIMSYKIYILDLPVHNISDFIDQFYKVNAEWCPAGFLKIYIEHLLSKQEHLLFMLYR